jgi:exodeoxyribonuclease V beta subunit
MQSAMREHNYGLQYFIYSVVLHHYLKQRLPNYSYQEHFGGVRYLFLRGMDAEQPMQGVFVDKPTLEIIEGLSEVLSGEAN